MRLSGDGTLTNPLAAPAGARLGSRWGWVLFDPPLRDPRALSATEFQISCRVCGSVLGSAQDPVGALHLAWRNRRHPIRHRGGT